MNAQAPNPTLVRGTTTGADCANCPFSKNGVAVKPVVSEGPIDPDWVIVGEGPGSQEVREQRPFCGPSGRLLNQALAAINVDRTRLHVTNATCCLPPPNATDTQKKKAQICCAPRLSAELAQFPSKPVLVLGAIAAQGFLGDKFSITQMAGALFERDIDGTGSRYFIPTVHPAAILRGGAGGGSGAHTVDLLFVNLVYDANKVSRLAAGKQVVFPRDIDYEISDPDNAQALVEGFAAHVRSRREYDRMIACDIEAVPGKPGTTALEPLYAKMTLIGLATTDWGISIAWHIANARTKKLVKALLEDSSITKAGHNLLLYDKPALSKHGMEVLGRIEDTLLLHHNAFPGSPHDLQRVATQFFAIPPWKSEHRVDKKFVLYLKDELEDEEQPDETESEEDAEARSASEQKFITELGAHAEYNALDTLATARLVAPLQHSVKNSKADKTYAMDIEMARIAEQMHRDGVPISRTVNDALQKQFKAVIVRAKKEIEDRVHEPALWAKFINYLAGEQAKRIRKGDANDYLLRHAKRLQEAADDPPKFMIDSGEHIAAYLKARGVSMLAQTDKGKTSTKRDILESLTHVPEVREILDYREAKKMLSTFVLSVADHMDEYDRIHPRWSVNKITGRWGSEAPQVQNWPKADPTKNRPNLRTQVVAPPGRKLVGADFSALEARVIALISGDPFLCGVFTHPPDTYGPGDIHSQFARVLWSDFDDMEKLLKKKTRDIIKRVVYGSLYGADVSTLHAAVSKDYPEISQGQVRKMNETMKSKIPGVDRYYANLTRQVMQTGELRSFLLGRRRTFPTGNADPTDLRNFGVQATGADIANTGVLRLSQALPTVDPTAMLVLQIHDAIVVECDEDKAEAVKDCVVSSLTQTHTNGSLSVLFPVEANIGDSWSEV